MLSEGNEFQKERATGERAQEELPISSRSDHKSDLIGGLHLELNSLLSSEPFDASRQGEAVALSWSILRESGFPTFGDIRTKRSEDFCGAVPVAIREAVSLSLDTVGWLSYAPKPEQFDRAAQMFARAVPLCPLDLGRLEKFAIIAGEIKPEQIVNLRHDPVKQAQTAIGFAIQSTKHSEHALEEVFGITRETLNDASGQSLNLLIAAISDDESRYVARMLRHLAHLHALQAAFFDNGVHASKAIAAGCSALQIIGLPGESWSAYECSRTHCGSHLRKKCWGTTLSLLSLLLRRFRRGSTRNGNYLITMQPAVGQSNLMSYATL